MSTSDSGSPGGGGGQLASDGQQWHLYEHTPSPRDRETHERDYEHTYQPPSSYQHVDQPKQIPTETNTAGGRPKTPGDVLLVPGGGQQIITLQEQQQQQAYAAAGYQYYAGGYIPQPAPPTYYSLLPEHHSAAPTYITSSQLYSPGLPEGYSHQPQQYYIPSQDYFEEFLQIQGWTPDQLAAYHHSRQT